MHIYTMKQKERFRVIEDIIATEQVGSQEELISKLEEKGIKCTQGTLSRNLRQLGIIRVPSAEGRMEYRLPSADESALPHTTITSLRDMITSNRWVRDIMLIKCFPGFAPAIASAIDRYGSDEIAGTVAGDDTLLIIPAERYTRESVDNIISTIFS